MNSVYLVFVVFLLPFLFALYLWRDVEPKKPAYFMCLSVSVLAMVVLVLSDGVVTALMPLGLFMASTSFFAGIFLSGFLRAWRKRGQSE